MATREKVKSVYIAGPMSGLPEFNFPAFFAAEKRLTTEGWFCFNPAKKDAERNLEGYADGNSEEAIKKGFDLRAALIWDTTSICLANGIYMLRGWETSPGARAEHALACALKRHYPDYEIMYET